MGNSYTLTLIADWNEPVGLSDRTRLLRLDPDQFPYKLKHGTEILLVLKVQAPREVISRLHYHQLNGVCWPAPGAEVQFFTTALREDPDQPDATILWAGNTRFGPFSDPKPPKKKGGNYEKTAQMTFPDRLLLIHDGRFSFLFSLTLRHEPAGGKPSFRTFVTDPEVDVEPSGGGGPLPTARRSRRGR